MNKFLRNGASEIVAEIVPEHNAILTEGNKKFYFWYKNNVSCGIPQDHNIELESEGTKREYQNKGFFPSVAKGILLSY